MPYRKAVEILCKNTDRDPLNFHVYFIENDKNLEGFQNQYFRVLRLLLIAVFALHVIGKTLCY